MSNNKMENLAEKILSDEKTTQEILKAKDIGEVYGIIKEIDPSITKAEIEEIIKNFKPEDLKELKEEQLKILAGGKASLGQKVTSGAMTALLSIPLAFGPSVSATGPDGQGKKGNLGTKISEKFKGALEKTKDKVGGAKDKVVGLVKKHPGKSAAVGGGTVAGVAVITTLAVLHKKAVKAFEEFKTEVSQMISMIVSVSFGGERVIEGTDTDGTQFRCYIVHLNKRNLDCVVFDGVDGKLPNAEKIKEIINNNGEAIKSVAICSVENVGKDVLTTDMEIEHLYFGQGVKNIAGDFLKGSTHLKSIYFGADVEKFDAGAFDSCNALHDVTFEGMAFFSKGRKKLFDGCKSLAEWFVPTSYSGNISTHPNVSTETDQPDSDAEFKKCVKAG